MDKIKKLIPIVLVVLLSYWSVDSLFSRGFFPMHDDTQVTRVQQMHEALADGMFPVRWVPDLGYGYGYPIFNFYAPFAYYVGASFMFLGFNALAATKVMIGLGTVLAGVFMYLLAREFWGKMGGIVSALLYVYAPYHALNIYVRGAISELWGYVFVPLVFLGIYKIYNSIENYTGLQPRSKIKDQRSNTQFEIKKRIWWWVCLTAVSYAAVIISHNLTAMMVTPFLLVFAGFLYIKLRRAETIYRPYFVFLGLLIGILLAAFYWLPVLFEMKYTDVLSVVGGGSDYRDHFICLGQLWNSPWGFAGSAPGCVDGFSLKIGKIHILLGALSVFAIYRLYKKDRLKFQINVVFLVFLLASVFLTLSASKFIWDLIPQMAFFQFPWRFLTLVVFFISFIAGGTLWFLKKLISSRKINEYINALAFVLLVSVIIYLDARVFMPQSILDKGVEDYTREQTVRWEISKISDEYMPPGFLKPLGPKSVADTKFVQNEDVKVLSLSEKTGRIRAKVAARKRAVLQVNIAYFPGWHVYIDGVQEWFKYSSQGLFIDIPEGEHIIEIRYTQTPIQKTGNALSLAGVFLLLAGIMHHRKT
jgi:hypothetical protein